ncbi:hypothetical protein L202_01467 [Cryptococcus amylolentus CBS 6039]|uniref:BZIP domain-containing protein n=1 Tax=Cryptococcus amylolentus CBS 6039 TaxID=1295533 RepID=A0A1E3I432_9TREE|nr:hypothetical protein L202_01467 [Cryptococcus amylolentus CBS 6039]ODN83298.1 hypothetical protein L202_01467 [Cryptococcus amylolentus CBS 6039]
MPSDDTMGGLDALVAAASSVREGKRGKAAGNGKDASAANIAMDMIDPSLHNENGDKLNPSALKALLNAPHIRSYLAEYYASNPSSLSAQLFAGGAPTAQSAPGPPTPAQVTRYGRISRPSGLPPTPGRSSSAAAAGGSSETGGNDTQLQLIKDALENVQGAGSEGQASDTQYEGLANLASGQAEGRFWKTGENSAASAAWDGAETLQAALKDSDGQNKRPRVRSGPSEDKEEGNEPELPQWPLPPTGKGGRKAMPRDELLARRRARNKVAAQESRKRKKMHYGTLEEQLQEKDNLYAELQTHCRNLERELELTKRVLTNSGIPHPHFVPEVHAPLPPRSRTSTEEPDAARPRSGRSAGSSAPTPGVHAEDYSSLASLSMVPSAPTPAPNPVSAPPAGPAELAFSDLFNIDEDDNDADFVPASSPGARESDSEDSEEEEVEESRPRKKARGAANSSSAKGKGKAKAKQVNEEEIDELATPSPETPASGDEDDDEEENLFLPIEDVPIPPRDHAAEEQTRVMEQAMKELGVETPEELMEAVRKLVETTDHGGVTPAQVGTLTRLLALGQAQGMNVW